MSKAILTKEQATVEKLLPDIRATHTEFLKSGQTTVDLARQIGDMLWKLKECVKHGEWQPLIEDRCELPMRTATAYMKLSGGWELLEKKEAAASTINGCIKLICQSKPKKGGKRLAKPKAPKAAGSNGKHQQTSAPQTGPCIRTGAEHKWGDDCDLPGHKCCLECGEPDGPVNRKVSGGVTFDPAELTSDSKDAFGDQAPAALRQVFELSEEFDAQRAKLSGIKSWITQRLGHPGAAVLIDAEQRIKTDIDQAAAELKFARPYCACVYCQNKAPKVANCTACNGRGWITEPIYKAAPKGLKREKAQA